MKLLSSVVALSAFLASGVQGWWDVPHGASGAIAYLLMKDPSARENLRNILTFMPAIATDINGGKDWPVGQFGPNVPNELRPPQNSVNLANAAIWPDVVKGFYNVKAFDNWHYTNQLYDPNSYGTCKVEGMLDAGQLTNVFNDMIRFGGKYNGRTTAYWYQGFSVNMVSHLFGDIMMPFHMMAYCFEDGTTDLGGNKWDVSLVDAQGNKVSNMHALWDSVALTWANDVQKDIIINDNDYVQLANLLLQDPELSLEAINNTHYGWDFKNHVGAGVPTQPVFYNIRTDLDADAVYNRADNRFMDRLKLWADESYNVAAEAYNRIPRYSTVEIGSDNYNWLIKMSKQRIMLAGYRMAAVFDEWLSTKFIGAPTPAFSQVSEGAGEPTINMYSPPADNSLYMDTQTGTVYKYDRSFGEQGRWILHHSQNPNGNNAHESQQVNECSALDVSSKYVSNCEFGLVGAHCMVKCASKAESHSMYQCQRQGNGNKVQWVGSLPHCNLGARRRTIH